MAPSRQNRGRDASGAAAGRPTAARSYRREPYARPMRRGDADSVAAEPAPIVDPRENDFSARSWWMVDVDGGDNAASSQGATALVRRCMRVHGWDLPLARRVLSEYRKFLSLKKERGDWDATELSPCRLVDLMWHQHILDNFNYYHDMILLCGRFVGHNPDGALDIQGKAERDRFTRQCLRDHCGGYDVSIWDGADAAAGSGAGDNSEGMAIGGRHARAGGGDNVFGREHANRPANGNAPADAAHRGQGDGNNEVLGNGGFQNNDPIQIRVKDQTGEETMFRARRSTLMSKIFNLFAMRKGVEVCSLNFLLDGESIVDPTVTPEMLELVENDLIDVVLKQGGC